jgi:hypothetical protein
VKIELIQRIRCFQADDQDTNELKTFSKENDVESGEMIPDEDGEQAGCVKVRTSSIFLNTFSYCINIKPSLLHCDVITGSLTVFQKISVAK